MQNQFVDANIPLIVKAIVIVGAVLTIIGMIGELVKIAKLEVKGFEYTVAKYEELINGH